MENKPLISIVTVSYNTVSTIERTILSVINQSYPNIEYIIIDGGSTDGTVDVIKKYADRIAYWISEPDGGIYDAMNKGIEYANGEYINFMNAGDCFVDNIVVNKIFSKIISNNIGVIFGEWYLKYNNKYRLKQTSPFYKNKNKFKEMGFSHQSVFVKTILAKKYPFDLNYKLCADYNMIWNLYYKIGTRFQEMDFPICIMEDSCGATHMNYHIHINEVCNICELNKSYLNDLRLYKYKARYLLGRLLKKILYN